VDDRNIKLTNDFFSQMDTLGAPIYESYKEHKFAEVAARFV